MLPSAFFTRSRANEGRRLPLTLPDGTKTNEWLLVLGYDSDRVVAARAKYRALAIENASKDATQQLDPASFASSTKFTVLGPAVADWSLESPCTEENVLELLTECPTIADDVERLVYDRIGFFENSSTPSTLASSESADLKQE